MAHFENAILKKPCACGKGWFASRGESSKLISYRLGLSQSHISQLLNDAMRKLHVKTPAQLVEKMRGVQTRDPSVE